MLCQMTSSVIDYSIYRVSVYRVFNYWLKPTRVVTGSGIEFEYLKIEYPGIAKCKLANCLSERLCLLACLLACL